MEELEGRRKKLYLANLKYSRSNLERAIEARGNVSAELKASFLRQYDALAERHDAMETRAYNTDEESNAFVTQLLEAKTFAQDLLDLNQEKIKTFLLLNKMPMQSAHRVMAERCRLYIYIYIYIYIYRRLDSRGALQRDAMGQIMIGDWPFKVGRAHCAPAGSAGIVPQAWRARQRFGRRAEGLQSQTAAWSKSGVSSRLARTCSPAKLRGATWRTCRQQ